jgi:hypothetical protein
LLLVLMIAQAVTGNRPDGTGIGEERRALLAFVVYSVAYFLFTALTSASNSSWGRYMMVIFPCIWIAASWCKRRRAYRRIFQLSLLLQCLFFSAAVLLQVTP